jgi:hypothetical protein
MNETNEKFLAMMLEGYEQNVAGITEGIKRLEAQLVEAQEARTNMEKDVADLKDLLGLEDEVAEEEDGE